MEKEIISVDYKGYKIIADILPANSTPQVICMHGAGSSAKIVFDPIRELLAKNNIFSCAIDFLGYGDTGGNVYDSSLKSRTEQAELIIEKAKVTQPLIIIGGSMGCYNAIKLTEIYPVKLLVLSAPAVYAKDVYEVNFGENFKTFIREPESWDSTDAWEILKRYTGKILILTGGKDQTIPPEIPQKIYDSSSQASYREIINFPESPHRIVKEHLNNHEEDLKTVIDKITQITQITK